MGTVTGFTAARMQAIVDETIVDADVIAGHLILLRHDGNTVDAGVVIGPQGIQGIQGTNGVLPCTSTTRPTGGARYIGLNIYETDTHKQLVWNGVRWDPQWNTEWGEVAYATLNNVQTPITAVVDITNLNVTWAAIANRKYETTLYLPQFQANAATTATVYITDQTNQSNVIHSETSKAMVTSEVFGMKIVIHELGLPTGNITRKGRVGAAAGSVALTGAHNFISIKDIGPNGLPV